MEVDKDKIDRKGASKLMKVSIRTVDRYIKAKKLSTGLINGRIWLSRKEVADFMKSTVIVDNVDMSTPKKSIDSDVDRQVDNSEFVYSVSTPKIEKKGGITVYKRLYLELKEELNEKQERLEIANYRVGQLETQVRNSIPMLEYHRENFEKKQKEEELTQQIQHRETMIDKLSARLKLEKYNKTIFLIILLVVLALQPLWLIYIYN